MAQATDPGADGANPAPPLLRLRGVSVTFKTSKGLSPVVRGLDLDIRAGETVALVGESGCGKSVTALSILRLLPPAHASIGGSILFEGRELLSLPLKDMQDVRGDAISMVFQEPMTSLNPVMTIGEHLVETIRQHRRVSRAEALRQGIELLKAVRMPDPERRMAEYPHRLSGGQRQRVMIAMAIACRPKLLLADEPTTALDVTVQAQILALLRQLQQDFGIAILLITHDLRVVADFADRVVVMYAGRKVEDTVAGRLFGAPQHPYTQGLLAATPRGMRDTAGGRRRLREIAGTVPDPMAPPPGCPFQPRCSRAIEQCGRELPLLGPADGDGLVACFRPGAAP